MLAEEAEELLRFECRDGLPVTGCQEVLARVEGLLTERLELPDVVLELIADGGQQLDQVLGPLAVAPSDHG